MNFLRATLFLTTFSQFSYADPTNAALIWQRFLARLSDHGVLCLANETKIVLSKIPAAENETSACVPSSLDCLPSVIVVSNRSLVGFVKKGIKARTAADCVKACILSNERFGFQCASAQYFPRPSPTNVNCLLKSATRYSDFDRFLADIYEQETYYLEPTCSSSHQSKAISNCSPNDTQIVLKPIVSEILTSSRSICVPKTLNCESEADLFPMSIQEGFMYQNITVDTPELCLQQCLLAETTYNFRCNSAQFWPKRTVNNCQLYYRGKEQSSMVSLGSSTRSGMIGRGTSVVDEETYFLQAACTFNNTIAPPIGSEPIAICPEWWLC